MTKENMINKELRKRVEEEIKYQWKKYQADGNITSRSIAEILQSHLYESQSLYNERRNSREVKE